MREGFEIRQLLQGGHRQWRHNELMLGPHVQPHAAGYHYLQPGADSQQFGQHHGGINDLLEVVQQQEQLFLFESSFEQ